MLNESNIWTVDSLSSQLTVERAAHEQTRREFNEARWKASDYAEQVSRLLTQLTAAEAKLRESESQAAAIREAIKNRPNDCCMSLWDGLHGMSIGVAPDSQGILDWAAAVFPAIEAALTSTAGRELLDELERLREAVALRREGVGSEV